MDLKELANNYGQTTGNPKGLPAEEVPIEEEETQDTMRETVQNVFENTLDEKKSIELVEQSPQIDEELIDEAIEESIKEIENEPTITNEDVLTDELQDEVIPEEIIKQFEELETLDMQNATKQDIQDIKEILVSIRHEIADTKTEVTRRETEYVKYLSLIFDRLKFLKGRIGKWFIISSIIILIGGGVTFTTIYHHWDSIEPKINAILGVVKIANNVSKVGG